MAREKIELGNRYPLTRRGNEFQPAGITSDQQTEGMSICQNVSCQKKTTGVGPDSSVARKRELIYSSAIPITLRPTI